MARETTREAQMMRLILETISELPKASRAVSTLTMAHNMISELNTEVRTLRCDKGRLDYLNMTGDRAMIRLGYVCRAAAEEGDSFDIRVTIDRTAKRGH